MNTVPPRDAQGNPLTAYIYALLDPETLIIRYIGKTTDSLIQRLSNHLSEKKDDRKNRWFNKLKRSGLKPLIQLVEEVPIDQWRERECYWIAFYNAQGHNLTNTALGGQGGENHSPETKAKIAKTLTGRKLSPESIAKRSAAMKGRKRSPEHCENIAASHRGKKRAPFSDEWKQKLSAVSKGKKRSDTFRERVSLGQKRRHAMRKLPPPGSPTLWD